MGRTLLRLRYTAMNSQKQKNLLLVAEHYGGPRPMLGATLRPLVPLHWLHPLKRPQVVATASSRGCKVMRGAGHCETTLILVCMTIIGSCICTSRGRPMPHSKECLARTWPRPLLDQAIHLCSAPPPNIRQCQGANGALPWVLLHLTPSD